MDTKMELLGPEDNESCDRCGTHVRATARFTMATGASLTFCGHHAVAVMGEIPVYAEVLV